MIKIENMLDAEALAQPNSLTIDKKKTEKEYQIPKAMLRVMKPTAMTTQP
jgi:hypothetical protein